MINLKELTEGDRSLIGVQANCFFLSYNKLKSCISIFNHLKEVTGLSKSYDREIWMLITCAGKALKAELVHSELSLTYSKYKFVNEEFGIMLSHKRARRVVELLDDLGYIIYYKGYGTYDPDNKNWMRSVIKFESKFTNLFSKKVINLFSKGVDMDEMLEIRDSKTKENILSYRKVKGVSWRRGFMFEYNKLLREHEITLYGVKCSVMYKQIFNDDLESGGRLYTFGTFQTLKSELRKDIRIDGEGCTEIDISNLHGSILRILQNLPQCDRNFDQYGVDGFPRHVCKAAMMCMINCKTKRGSGVALYNISKEHSWDLSKEYCFEVISAMCEHNNPVKFFGKNVPDWKVLQRFDSKICEFIIQRFIDKGEPVLCYHDSWVVKKEMTAYLKESIQLAWRSVMKVDYDCKIKVEF